MTQAASPCPNCGYKLEPGAPICGNCGNPREAYGSQTSLAASGTGRGKVFLAVLVLAGVGALGWFAIPRVGDIFDGESFQIDEFTPEVGNGAGGDSVSSPYEGVRELVAALNDGGLRCTRAKVDSADEYVATGSCQAPGTEFARTHVQINMYFNRTTLEFAEDIFDERAFTFVHDDNWFVVTQLPTARRVHEILGGRLVRAKDI